MTVKVWPFCPCMPEEGHFACTAIVACLWDRVGHANTWYEAQLQRPFSLSLSLVQSVMKRSSC